MYANDLFCKYSKYTRSELVGKNHRIINSGYHSKDFFAELWKTILSGKIWRGEIKNKAKDGSYYWVDTVISPAYNSAGEIEQFLSIRNPITEKKQHEEELKFVYSSLINIEEEERTRFATEIHDGIAQILVAAKMLLSRKLKEGNGDIKYISDLLQSAINDCKIITSNAYPKIISDNCCLCESINNLINTIKKATDISIHFSCPANFDRFFSNHTQFIIYRMLQECFNNAIKHSLATEIHLEIIRNQNNFSIVFSDNGIGIPEAILSNPKRFSYLRMRIISLNGKLNITSEKMKGAMFHFTIPVNILI